MLNFSQNLIRAAGGDMRPGEKLKNYLWALSAKTGIDIFSLEKAWRGQYLSKKTKAALQRAAQERVKNNARTRIDGLASWIDEIEKIDPVVPRQHIAAIRDAIAVMREVAELQSRVAVRVCNFDDGQETEEKAK